MFLIKKNVEKMSHITIYLLVINELLLFVFGDENILRLPKCNKYASSFSQIHDGYKLKNAMELMASKETCIYTCVTTPPCTMIAISKEDERKCLLSNGNASIMVQDEKWMVVKPERTKHLGGVCMKKNPCILGRCVDACESPGYKCICEFGIECDVRVLSEATCYGAKDNQAGVFTVNTFGGLIKVRMEHLNGSLSCHNPLVPTKWGCDSPIVPGIARNLVATLLTNDASEQIAPAVRLNHFGFYELPGYHANSDAIELDIDMHIAFGDVLKVWYGEDFIDGIESDNEGIHCVKVLGFFKL